MALLHGKLAEVVYLPPDVRRTKHRINAAGHATTSPPSPKEALDRIVTADPLGFLIAVMNGQPTMTFSASGVTLPPKKVSGRVKAKAPTLQLGTVDGFDIMAHVHVPTMDERLRVAQFLVPFVTEKRKKKTDDKKPKDEDDEFEQILKARRQQAKDEDAEAEG